MGDHRKNNAMEASWGMGASKCQGNPNPGSWVIVSPPRATQGAGVGLALGWASTGVSGEVRHSLHSPSPMRRLSFSVLG